MELEVKTTVLGKFVPQHLVNFSGDERLQNYFRGVVEHNYEKGISTIELGRCSACFHPLSVADAPRLRWKVQGSHRQRKLFEKSKTRPLSRYQDYILNKYLNSSRELIVHCPSCGFVNSTSVTSRRDCLTHKEMLMETCRVNSVPVDEEVTPVSKKKKKKKKKAKEDHGIQIQKSEASLQLQEEEEEAFPSRVLSTPSPSTSVSPNTRQSIIHKTQEKSTSGFVPLTQKGQFVKNHRRKEHNTTGFKHRKGLKAFLNDNQSGSKGSSLKDFLSSL